jgi:mono/diheme cytochrome c family protein
VVSDKAKTVTKLGVASLVLMMALAPVVAQQTAPAAAAAKGDAAKGKVLFDSSSCGACHVLEAAGAVGEVGPSLDRNAKLTHAFIVGRVAAGQGAMPSYGEQLSEAEVDDIAAYVLSATAK